MMATPDITNIPAPRVPLIDERTGTISREWYRFLLNLFRLTGSGSNDTTLTEIQYLPHTDPAGMQNPEPVSLFEAPQPMIGVEPAVEPVSITPEDFAALVAATEAMAIAPAAGTPGITAVVTDATLTGTGTAISPLGVTYPLIAVPGTAAYADVVDFDFVAAPAIKTADFTVVATDKWLINNKAASTCTVTLPAAASFSGRELTFQNYRAFTVVSASANVVPQGGGTVGTAILLGVVGNWATLVSNGADWVIMQAAAYNNLLLE